MSAVVQNSVGALAEAVRAELRCRLSVLDPDQLWVDRDLSLEELDVLTELLRWHVGHKSWPLFMLGIGRRDEVYIIAG